MVFIQTFKFHLLVLLGLWSSFCPSVWAVEPMRIGLTPTFLTERHALLAEWRAYLESKMGRPVAFVINESHEATLEMLHQKHIQAAWMCDCAHITGHQEFRYVAMPLFQGRPYYRAYLIVPETDRGTRSILDLKDKVFAYTDPYSHVGYLNPRYELKKQGADPDLFFRRTFLTRSHRKAIEAVAVGVADAASVNSYIWETVHKVAPALTSRTRIVARSQEYGFPPFVADDSMPVAEFDRLREALIGMAGDAHGRELLVKMNLDGFAPPQPEIYRPVREMVRYMKGG